MKPFTFNPGPRLLAGENQATALAEQLPPGPCLFVTDQALRKLVHRVAIGQVAPVQRLEREQRAGDPVARRAEAQIDDVAGLLAAERPAALAELVEDVAVPDREGRRPERRLGHAQETDRAVVEQLPETAQRLINASADLYARVKRLDEGTVEAEIPVSPARALMGRLERGLGGGSL